MTTPTSVVCNRKACQKPLSEPRWWNTSTRAYYCADCKRAITRYPENAHIFEDHAMTTPTSEPTEVRCEVCGHPYKEGWPEYHGINCHKEMRAKVSDLRTALANAEREREAADDKRRQAEAAHADLTRGLMSAYEDLATVRAERDALQRTVAGYGDLLKRSQEMIACFDDPEAMAYDGATTKAYFRQAVAALTTPTREGSTDA